MKKLIIIFLISFLSSDVFATDANNPINFTLRLENSGNTEIYFCDANKTPISTIAFAPIEGGEQVTKETTAEAYLYWSIFDDNNVQITITERDISGKDPCFGLSPEADAEKASPLNYKISYEKVPNPEGQNISSDHEISVIHDAFEDFGANMEHELLSSMDRSLQLAYNTQNYSRYDERKALIKLTLTLYPPQYTNEETGEKYNAFSSGVYYGFLVVEMISN